MASDGEVGSVSDGELIASSVRDPERFRPVFDRHFEAVRRYAVLRVGIDGAEDVTAETFAVALRRRAAYEPMTATALPWLLGIATRVAQQQKRGDRRLERALARVGTEAACDGEDASIERLDAHALSPRLRAALASLRAGDRDLVLLVVVAGLSYEEVASALAMPVGTVRSRLSRARTRLAAHFPERSPK
jgi:RNA polymerase sigma-70 factor (ECF subfamily)